MNAKDLIVKKIRRNGKIDFVSSLPGSGPLRHRARDQLKMDLCAVSSCKIRRDLYVQDADQGCTDYPG